MSGDSQATHWTSEQGAWQAPGGAAQDGQNTISNPPNWSKVSAVPGTPGLFWVNRRPRVVVSPPAEPRAVR